MVVTEFLGFDPVKDISEVDQFGYVNLVEALENGVIQSTLKIDDLGFNDIDDPASIMGKPRDVFEAYKMASVIHDRGKKSNEVPPS